MTYKVNRFNVVTLQATVKLQELQHEQSFKIKHLLERKNKFQVNFFW